MSSPMDELRNELETQTTATNEVVRAMMAEFVKQAKADMADTRATWKAHLAELEEATDTTIKSAITRMRQPIQDGVKQTNTELAGIAQRIQGIHAKLEGLQTEADTTIEAIAKDARAKCEREFRAVVHLAADSRWVGFWFAFILILGFSLGMVVYKFGIL